MPSVQTRFFGTIDYSDESVIHTPLGIPGFNSERAFLLIQLPGQHPLVYLQSMQTAELCFPALPVRVASAQYEIEIGDDDRAVLGVRPRPTIGQDVLCLALVSADETGAPTANLMAPVVIHLRSRVGIQCVNAAGPYDLRHPLETAVPA
jgi:flagellar assembly factor FliW